MLTPRYRRALSDRVWNLIVRKSPLRDLVEARGWAQSSSRTVDAILGWLTKRATDRPFFVFANFMDVHGPRKPSFHHLRRYRPLRPGYWVRVYGAPDAYVYNAGLKVFSAEEMEIWHDLYDASLATLDVEIGRLLAELECLQYLDNTMLLITADHGDHLGDHEILGHGLSVYDSLIHVPLLVWHPEFSPREVNAPVELTSMFTTLAQVAGVPSGEYASQTRRPSLLDNLDATARSSFSFSEYADDGGYHRHRMLELNPAFNRFRPLDGLVAVRSARYKYIWAKNGDDEFYDLAHDPQETNNLIAEAPHDLRNMRNALRDWQLSLNPYPLEIAEKWEENMDPKIVARLQALGYLDQ
jgi:arylsulfatase A-like enzyme